MFGYILGYPLVYFYSSSVLINISTLRNFRLYVQLNDYDDEILLYSFSCPLHSNIDQKQIDLVVENFLSSLSIAMNENPMIKCYRLDNEIKEQSTWCL